MGGRTAVLFDLDDTLYLEQDFFRSGSRAVAAELRRRGLKSGPSAADVFLELHLEDRDRVFDRAAESLGYPTEWVGDLVDVFRSHEPDIRLAPEVPAVLTSLRSRSILLGVITDGHADAQRRKIASLGIRRLVDAIVVTDDFGRDFWKPHPLPFHRCMRQLGVDRPDVTFVGDHPDRDVLGARRAGLKCVRIRRPGGYFSGTSSPAGGDACPEIADLKALAPFLPAHEVVT